METITAVATLLSAIAALAAVVIGWRAIREQNKNARIAHSVNLIPQLREQFESAEMIEHRRQAARFVRLSRHRNPHLPYVLHFFEILGFLQVRKGVLDQDLVWFEFFYFLYRWRHLTREHIKEVRRNNPAAYEDLEALYKKLTEVQKKRIENVGGSFSEELTDREVHLFLQQEGSLSLDEES